MVKPGWDFTYVEVLFKAFITTTLCVISIFGVVLIQRLINIIKLHFLRNSTCFDYFSRRDDLCQLKAD